MIDDWIGKVWQNHRHTGLRDLYEPSICYSPNEMFRAAVDFAAPIAIDLEGLDIRLLPSVYRTVQADGVHIRNFILDSPAIHEYRGRKSTLASHKAQWEIKVNPYDPTSAWFRTPENNFLPLRWRDENILNHPHVADIHTNLRSARDQRTDAAFEQAALQGTPMPTTTTEWETTEPEPDGDLSHMVLTFEYEEEEEI